MSCGCEERRAKIAAALKAAVAAVKDRFGQDRTDKKLTDEEREHVSAD